MTTTISTLAARVAFHEIPGRIVSAFALTTSSFGSPCANRRGPRRRRRWRGARGLGDVRHLASGAGARGADGGAGMLAPMSEHTDRLRSLRARILSAKEFL